MKKAILILALIVSGVILQAQTNTVLIFKSMLPKVQVAPEPLSDANALIIWNAMKVYPSPHAFVEANSGAYPLQDVRQVYKEAKEILKVHLLPFINGTLFKESIQTDTDDEGNPIYTDVFWDMATEKVAYRNYWRANFGDSYVLDIQRIYLDYDSSAF